MLAGSSSFLCPFSLMSDLHIYYAPHALPLTWKDCTCFTRYGGLGHNVYAPLSKSDGVNLGYHFVFIHRTRLPSLILLRLNQSLQNSLPEGLPGNFAGTLGPGQSSLFSVREPKFLSGSVPSRNGRRAGMHPYQQPYRSDPPGFLQVFPPAGSGIF